MSEILNFIVLEDVFFIVVCLFLVLSSGATRSSFDYRWDVLKFVGFDYFGEKYFVIILNVLIGGGVFIMKI